MCVIVLDSLPFFSLPFSYCDNCNSRDIKNSDYFFTLLDFRNYFATEDKCLQLD